GLDIALVDFKTLRLLRRFESSGTAMSVAPDGKSLVSAGSTSVQIWSLDTGGDEGAGREVKPAQVAQVERPETPVASESTVSVSPSAAAGGDGDYLGRKYALVLGLAAYEEDPLDNPENDAQDMAESLKRLGFNVQIKLNPDLAQMRL